MRRRAAGYTLLEIIVAMAVFGIFLSILIRLTAEMRHYEKKLPVNFMKHPQVITVVSRMRRDVLDAVPDATGNPYLSSWPPQNPQYTNSSQVLILRTLEPGGQKVVVWDFREESIVTRRSYNVGVPTDWVARGMPSDFEVDSAQVGYGYAVRLKGKDKKGRLAIDQIFQPRAHP